MSVFTESGEIQQRRFAENDLAFAILTNIPITPGHSLIIPKREIANFAELTSHELLAIHDLTKDVMKLLELEFQAEGFNCAWNQGADYGQSVLHYHLHVVPRTAGDQGIYQYDPRQFLYRPGSREVTPEKELELLATKLKERKL